MNIDFAAEENLVACSVDAVAVAAVAAAAAAAWRWVVETALVVVLKHLHGMGVGEEAGCKGMVGMEERTVIGYLGLEEEGLVVAEYVELVAVAEESLVDFVVKSLAAELYGKIPLEGY